MKRRILVVDDNPQLRAVVHAVLGEEQFELHGARSGEECLTLARELKPDLVLLDVMTPGMDGYEVCRLLKRSPATAHIAVMIMTTNRRADDVVKAASAGANAFLSKPFNIGDLFKRVVEMVCAA